MQFAIQSPTMAYLPEYFAGYGCACDGLGMVSPANVATFGIMDIGRSTYSYDRAIARVKAKINLLKKKRSQTKLVSRKSLLTSRINKLQAQLSKLKEYKKVRVQKKLDKTGTDVAIADDEDLVLTESMANDAEIMPLDLQAEEQITISQGDSVDWMQIALYGGLAVLGVVGAKMFFGRKAPRQNRLRMGVKSNPKRRKAKRKVRKNRK